jgi:MFS family permease
MIPLKVQSLGLSGLWLGGCEAALSIGLLLGSFHGSDALVSRFGRFNVRVGAAMCEGLALAASGWAHTPLFLVFAFVCVGFANASMSLVGATHRSLAIPQNFRVRLLAASMMTTQIAGILGPMIAGATLSRWAVSQVYICFGLATCLLAFSFVLIPRSREFFALSHEQVKDWFGHEYPDAFKTSTISASRQVI